MKKLKLDLSNIKEILSREQMKEIVGGDSYYGYGYNFYSSQLHGYGTLAGLNPAFSPCGGSSHTYICEVSQPPYYIAYLCGPTTSPRPGCYGPFD